MLTQEDLKKVIDAFPIKKELCYEIFIHKKVYDANVLFAIPEGKRCYVWFTFYNDQTICLLLELDDNKCIINVKQLYSHFDDKLASGTIFYGTFVSLNSSYFFCIEDIYFYAGKNVLNMPFLTKLHNLKYIFENELPQNSLSHMYTTFCLPLMKTELKDLLNEIHMLPYEVSHIKHRYFDSKLSKKILTMKYYKPNVNKKHMEINQKNITAVFNVTADIEPDIYHLFIMNNGKEEYHDIAFISNYNTSVMMNKLFRNIKENINLDAIEESDDEDEFQDNREDKYVYLDRSFKMKCEYNSKFKRWCPIEVENEENIVDRLSISISNLLKADNLLKTDNKQNNKYLSNI